MGPREKRPAEEQRGRRRKVRLVSSPVCEPLADAGFWREPLAVWLRMVQMVHWPDLSVLAGGRALEWLGPREGSWASLRVGAGVGGGDRPVACTALTPYPTLPCSDPALTSQSPLSSEAAQRPVCLSLPVSYLLPGSLGRPPLRALPPHFGALQTCQIQAFHFAFVFDSVVKSRQAYGLLPRRFCLPSWAGARPGPLAGLGWRL